MSDSRALTPIAEADYEAIEGAVMETHRGRWFLKEYARRNRAADTQMLLQAIERLEGMVVQNRETQEKDRLRMDLMEMARAISRTKSEIASLRPQGTDNNELGVASEALDAIVRTTERATSDILEAAEQVQEAAWMLREEGAGEAICDELDRRATDIYTACSFQDLTAQRTTRIVNTLRYLEGRINAMIEIWGEGVADETGAEAGEGSGEASGRARDLTDSLDDFNGLCQDGIDGVIVGDGEGDAVDAYFFERGESVDPEEIAPRLAGDDRASIEDDPVLLTDEIAVIEVPEADAAEAGPDALADESLVDESVADDALADDAIVDWSEAETKQTPPAPVASDDEASPDGDAVVMTEQATAGEIDPGLGDSDAKGLSDADTEAGDPEDEAAFIAAQAGPLPELDAMETREKLRRFS